MTWVEVKIMKELIEFQNSLLKSVNDKWFRSLYYNLWEDQRLLGIKGLRGVGKTTLLLQYLKFRFKDTQRGLYVTLDHPYFYQNSLFELASQWNSYGGKLLLIDEIHKYSNWSRELKLMYDGFPDMKFVFTSSSALDIYRGESDLSRRLIMHSLPGLSFREYISMHHDVHFQVVELEDLFNNNIPAFVEEVNQKIKPLALFKQYLKSGYFPFAKNENEETLKLKLIQIINTTLESDLAYVQNYSASHINNIKRLLGVVATSVPFEPNISRIAQKLKMGRDTVNHFLKHLNDAHLLILSNKLTKGMAALQKPDKIYIENTNFSYALEPQPDMGALRETFFINQLTNSGHKIHLAEKGDFVVNEKWIFEVGGKNKSNKQVSGVKNVYLAVDDIEYAYSNTVPLWVFGFLY